jgi:hypothetical protein
MEAIFGMWSQELKTQCGNKHGYGWMESTHYWSLCGYKESKGKNVLINETIGRC